mgnify:CR=1 FL=1
MTAWILFSVSLIVNIVFVWYLRQLATQFTNFRNNFEEFIYVIGEYRDHVKNISQMEAYFGDETITNLLRHTNETLNFVDGYSQSFSLDIDSEEEMEDYAEEEEV